jgi:RNA polymerase sigma-70 factor, ECF subfamily
MKGNMCLLSLGSIAPHPGRIPSTETSSTLLIKVRDKGDAESWRAFVAIYEPLIISYCRKRGLADHDARDVAQEVFVRLLRALPTFELNRDRGRFRTWLWQVTVSAMVDPTRGDHRRDAAERAWREQRIETNDDEIWRRLFQRRVLDCALRSVRARVSDRAWACFEAHLLQGRPAAHVADELGMTPSNVYATASRVLAQVRAACAQSMGDLADDPDDLSSGT